jgi:hypothetical protein
MPSRNASWQARIHASGDRNPAAGQWLIRIDFVGPHGPQIEAAASENAVR